ncbi:hypothetical protein GGS20DRAFT_567855 [Poronia punctata]|nr:hypothetical protein GGS20DRAFT_567855 [Poronia punctata]
MSEYWKSTPKYWCKHCSTYVRDTKLERQNHENTSKHQYALKRFLRDLHRGHENEEREKERTKREVDRLNGIVNNNNNNNNPPSSSRASSSSTNPNTIQVTTAAQRQQQWEQLAEMGIDVPTELRRDMAMAGEWTVTNTRVVDDTPRVTGEKDEVQSRKRPKLDDQDSEAEHENAVKGLFKKPKKWGRDTKQAVDDAELDALLSAPLTKQAKEEEEEEEEEEEKKEKPVLKEEDSVVVKKEETDTDTDKLLPAASTTDEPDKQDTGTTVKEEAEEITQKGAETPAVVFKKRKPKNIRQK